MATHSKNKLAKAENLTEVVNVRLPKSLLRSIEEAARDNRRTRSNQIYVLLASAMLVTEMRKGQ